MDIFHQETLRKLAALLISLYENDTKETLINISFMCSLIINAKHKEEADDIAALVRHNLTYVASRIKDKDDKDS